jgi:protein tyrosine phosphatase (PTP) superfamily phosphohydrolase (DUF442 family)
MGLTHPAGPLICHRTEFDGLAGERIRALLILRRFGRVNGSGRRWVGRLPFLALAVGIALLAYHFRRPLFQGNFGVVQPGLVYRSAQPGVNLPELVARHHLATILNLRAGSRADDFYRDETRTAEELGVAFYDLPLSANRRPTRRELLILLDLLDRCRYPLLIHCKSGSDRTGLVAGLYLMAVRGLPPRKALDAFTTAYGHFPVFGTARLHDPFQEYDRWLSDRGLSHTSTRLRHWVAYHYRAVDGPGPYPALRPGPRARLAAEADRTATPIRR